MNLQPASCAVLISTAVLMLLILGFNIYVMNIGSEKIFGGSGSPISMAQAILNSIQATSQFLFGIFIVALLAILIIEKVVEPNVGIPVITSVVGFLLGRTQKRDTQ